LEKLVRYVQAKMVKDWIEPYAKEEKKIPVVLSSNHPIFTEGMRFDWGFVQVAIGDGYTVTIHPFEITRSNCKHQKGFNRTCLIMGSGDYDYRIYSCPICGMNKYKKDSKKLPNHFSAKTKWDYEDAEV